MELLIQRFRFQDDKEGKKEIEKGLRFVSSSKRMGRVLRIEKCVTKRGSLFVLKRLRKSFP